MDRYHAALLMASGATVGRPALASMPAAEAST